MPTDVYRVDSYDFSDTDVFFLDTNIWLYVYAPLAPDDWKTRVYSKALSRVLTARSRIFIDSLVLSEFINRYARFQYNLSKDSGSILDFKAYRRSAEFKPVAKEIKATVRRILKHCQITESGFSDCDIDSLLAQYGEGNSDFNDQVMVELCRAKGFKLITHDSDFKGCGVPILTANNRMFA